MFTPKSKETSGYHIFIEPEKQIKKEIKDIIINIANKYSGPVFNPHITLIARVENFTEKEIIEKTKKLAKNIEPFNISLNNIEKGNEYFRSVYINAERTDEIMNSYKKAIDLFGLKYEKEYKPHLSLFYGDVSDKERDKIISNIDYNRTSFKVNKLHIYHTPGKVDTWKKVAEIPIIQ
jgi:2'-5' RNA ligase